MGVIKCWGSTALGSVYSRTCMIYWHENTTACFWICMWPLNLYDILKLKSLQTNRMCGLHCLWQGILSNLNDFVFLYENLYNWITTIGGYITNVGYISYIKKHKCSYIATSFVTAHFYCTIITEMLYLSKSHC